MFETIGGLLFVFLAVIHSALGEPGILKPLFAAEWTVADVPRWGMERILRFAWHLTSFAWLGIGAALLEMPPTTTFALIAFLSAGMVFVMLRGHLAWPIFLLAGLALAIDEFGVPDNLVVAVGMLTSVLLVLIAALHLYWALGGRTLAESAFPKERMQAPGPLITLAVATMLTAYATLVLASTLGVELTVIKWGVISGIIVLTIRAIGDGKYVGFTKQVRETSFGRLDDAYFTPVVVALAIGAGTTLLA